MSAANTVDIVIGVHDHTRPIRRAVASVLEGSPSSRISVIVVCHGIDERPVLDKLRGLPADRLRVVEFSDGLTGPTGPYNHGMAISTASHVMVMGSDDFLEPSAVLQWLSHVDRTGCDMLIAPLRHQGGARIPAPLTRIGRSARLDPIRDRLFYRTAPIGLIRRSALDRLGLRYVDGLATGEDMAMSVGLWTGGLRIDYRMGLPCYVVGADAETRVTTRVMPVETALGATNDTLDRVEALGLALDVRVALGIKLLRINVLGAMIARPGVSDWTAGDVSALTATAGRIVSISPQVLTSFSIADRQLIRAALDPAAEPSSITAAVAGAAAASRLQRLLPLNPLHVLDREGNAMRFLRYRLGR
ncbi:MAG: glycosyltransferase [Leifsonia flava]